LGNYLKKFNKKNIQAFLNGKMSKAVQKRFIKETFEKYVVEEGAFTLFFGNLANKPIKDYANERW
jgi:hypothetical protein